MTWHGGRRGAFRSNHSCDLQPFSKKTVSNYYQSILQLIHVMTFLFAGLCQLLRVVVAWRRHAKPWPRNSSKRSASLTHDLRLPLELPQITPKTFKDQPKMSKACWKNYPKKPIVSKQMKTPPCAFRGCLRLLLSPRKTTKPKGHENEKDARRKTVAMRLVNYSSTSVSNPNLGKHMVGKSLDICG